MTSPMPDNVDLPEMPRPQLVYGAIVYWMTVASCMIATVGPVISLAWPARNAIHPSYLFAAIFAGKPAQEVWQTSGGSFPGAHFYLNNMLHGDAFTQFGVALVGCGSAGWALLVVGLCYLRQGDRLYALMSFCVVLLLGLAMLGIISIDN